MAARGQTTVSARSSRRLAVALLGAWLAAIIALVVFAVISWGVKTEAEAFGVATIAFAIGFVGYPIVGAMIAFRQPGNWIGWLFIGVGLLFAAAALFPAYATYGVFVNPGSLPAAEWAAWVSGWLDPLFFLVLCLLLLLFPNGHVPSPRWGIVLWMVAVGVAVSLADAAVKPGQIRKELPIENPLGIERVQPLFDALDTPVFLYFATCMVLSVAGLVVRYRGSSGDARVQIKWIALSALFLFVSFGADIALAIAGAPRGFIDFLFGLAFASIPIAAGVAILRYRLYDIDRVISKTLAYGVLSVILAGVYTCLVLAGQALSTPFAGGSNLAIAVSTLVVAALFLPVRSRVQAFVDRRFNRHRYDAQKTLEAFGARLREQVDLGTLSVDLRTAVDETMQPAHVSVWLREGHV
jgi:hypothetical protein